MNRAFFLDEDRTIDASLSSDASLYSTNLNKNTKGSIREIGYSFSLYIQEIKRDFYKMMGNVLNEFQNNFQLFAEDQLQVQNNKQDKKIVRLFEQLKTQVQNFEDKYSAVKSNLPLIGKKTKSKSSEMRRNKFIDLLEKIMKREKQSYTLSLQSQNKSSAQTCSSSKIIFDQKINKAQTLSDRNRFGEAILILKQIDRKYKGHSEVNFILANCYKSTSNHKEALKEYSRALEICQKGCYHNNRGNCYVEMGEFRSALEDYRKASDMEPENATYYANYGNCCIHLNLFKDALGYYNKAIAMEPQRDQFFNNRAFTNIKLQNFNSALDDCATAIELNPTEHVYLKNRANIYIDKKQYKNAERDIKSAIEIEPQKAEFHFILAKCQYLSGKLKQTAQNMRTVTKLCPQKESYRLLYDALQNQLY